MGINGTETAGVGGTRGGTATVGVDKGVVAHFEIGGALLRGIYCETMQYITETHVYRSTAI